MDDLEWICQLGFEFEDVRDGQAQNVAVGGFAVGKVCREAGCGDEDVFARGKA